MSGMGNILVANNVDAMVVLLSGVVLIFFGLSAIGSEKGTTKLLEENFASYQVARIVISVLVVLAGIALSMSAARKILGPAITIL
jgi:hypothetical protein